MNQQLNRWTPIHFHYKIQSLLSRTKQIIQRTHRRCISPSHNVVKVNLDCTTMASYPEPYQKYQTITGQKTHIKPDIITRIKPRAETDCAITISYPRNLTTITLYELRTVMV